MKMAAFPITLLLFLSACAKERLPDPPPPPPPSPALKVVWQHPLSADLTDVSGDAWFVSNGNLIYTTDFTSPTGQIHCRNAATGELRWIHDDLYSPGWTHRAIVSIADKTIAATGRNVFCIDNQTGKFAWDTDLRPFSHQGRIYAVDDYVYDAHCPYGGAPYFESLSLARAHHATGHWDTLFTLPQDNKFYPHISSVSLWINPAGDSVLMVPFTMLGDQAVHGANQNRADLYAFNLRTRQMEWALKDFDLYRRGCPIYPPVISDNRLYINTNKTLYCIDLLSASVVWSRHFPTTSGSDIRFNSLKEYGNTILLVSDYIRLAMAISKTDGSTVWENKEVGAAADELTLFEGLLYYTSRGTGRLYAIEAATGKTIWNMGSPNRTGDRPASFGSQQLCIDPVGRHLYVTDKYFILCVELPEP